MATQPEGALPSDIASDKSYLKDYNKVLNNSCKPSKGLGEQPTKQKEMHFHKTLRKHNESTNSPFCFDVLAQLANFSVRITSYELCHLLNTTKESLRVALVDSEIS